MSQEFYTRLKNYYIKVGEVLRGQANAASIFPNPTDIGTGRENIYAKFLEMNLPAGCKVISGGFIFNLNGDESKQMDLMVISDSAIQYNFFNAGQGGKAFACIEGLIAIASIKSSLTSKELTDALDNISSLPDKEPPQDRIMPLLGILDYDDWPMKIIYATNGIKGETALKKIEDYYTKNSSIPIIKRPNIIHVAGKYSIIRTGPKGVELRNRQRIEPDTFHLQVDLTDVFGLTYVIHKIQSNAFSSRYIIVNYKKIFNDIPY